MKYLGLDLGSKTLGMALSETGIIATGYKTLEFQSDNYNQMYNMLKEEITALKIDVIVLGLPKHMNNDEGIRANLSSDLKSKLLIDFPNIKVFLVDERLTTKESFNIMRDLKKSIKDKKTLKDTLAAEIILQTFLNTQNG